MEKQFREPSRYLIFTEASWLNILEATGRQDEFRRGEIRCPTCDQVITWDNLRVIYPNKDTFDFICENSICFHIYLVSKSQKKQAAGGGGSGNGGEYDERTRELENIAVVSSNLGGE